MPTLNFFFMSATKGQSDRGDWYRISISVCEQSGNNERDFVTDFYVDVLTFAKVEKLTKFTELDCKFAPTASGRTRLLSVEAL